LSLLQDALRKAQKGEGGNVPSIGSPLPDGGGARSATRRRLWAGVALAAVVLLGAGAVILLTRFPREGSIKALQPSPQASAPSAQPTPLPLPSPSSSLPEQNLPAQERAPAPATPRASARISRDAPQVRARSAAKSRRDTAPSVPAATAQSEDGRASQLTRFNEGIAAQTGGDWESAARLFQEVVSKDPSIVEGWNNLGNALLRLGKLPEADRAFRKALSLDPDYPAALLNAGLLRLRDGRLAEAAPFFARAAALDPRNPAPRVNLAISQARRGAIAEAEETLAAARRAFPSNADVLYHLGTVYERAGNRDKAREAYASFLAVSNGRRPEMERLVRERLQEWDR